MEAATKNKRGRPRIFSRAELSDVDIDIDCGLSDRGRINRKYSEIGEDAVYQVLDPYLDNDIVMDLFGLDHTMRVGVLEQIGRMVKEGYPGEVIIKTIIRTKEMLEAGYRSKDIERWIRTGRKTGEW